MSAGGDLRHHVVPTKWRVRPVHTGLARHGTRGEHFRLRLHHLNRIHALARLTKRLNGRRWTRLDPHKRTPLSARHIHNSNLLSFECAWF